MSAVPAVSRHSRTTERLISGRGARVFVAILVLAIICSYVPLARAQSGEWETHFERSGGVRTPNYNETLEYCRRIERASEWVRVDSFGVSPQGRMLPLVILSRDRAFTPQEARQTDKAVVLIQNGIHAGEIDGKDACLMLMRDLAVLRTKENLLDHCILLIIPIFNVDGHERSGPYNRINQAGPVEMGWRTTAQNLNLNRDYVKADSPEMQAWLRMFAAWLPEFFVDCHVTDGADYQFSVTYSIETHPPLPVSVRRWVSDRYLPFVTKEVERKGVKLAPYILLKDEKDPSKGIIGGAAPPRFSTQYSAIQNRPGLLIETHMLKDYKTRVEGTAVLLEATLRCVNEDCSLLRKAVRDADQLVASGLPTPYPVRFELSDVPSDTVRYLGYRLLTEQSEISGAERIVYTSEPIDLMVPRYDSIVPEVSVVPPVAYLIPREWMSVIERLRFHGLKLERLDKDADVEVEQYRFEDARWQERPYEGRHPARYSVKTQVGRVRFPQGTVVLWLNQRAAAVAVHALEPQAPDALVAWGFFDAVFEQKEYAEAYVMETEARKMLERDAALRGEFNQRVESDSAFARSPAARLSFFYERSPYWDAKLRLYPVARLVKPHPLVTSPLP